MVSCFNPLNDPKYILLPRRFIQDARRYCNVAWVSISPIERATELVHSLTLETVPESVSKKSAYKTLF